MIGTTFQDFPNLEESESFNTEVQFILILPYCAQTQHTVKE